MLQLTVLEAPPDEVAPGESLTVGPAGATIGRVRDNSWILSDKQSLLSRTHFKISLEAGEYCLTDTSTNGTYLDDNDSPIGKGNSVPLQDGSQIRLGEYKLEAHIDSAPAQEARPLGSIPAFLQDLPDIEPSGSNDQQQSPPKSPQLTPKEWPSEVSAQPLPDDLFKSPPGIRPEPDGAVPSPMLGSATPSSRDHLEPLPDPLLQEGAPTPNALSTPSLGPIPSGAISPVAKSGEDVHAQIQVPVAPTPAPALQDSGASLIPDNWYDPVVTSPANSNQEPAREAESSEKKLAVPADEPSNAVVSPPPAPLDNPAFTPAPEPLLKPEPPVSPANTNRAPDEGGDVLAQLQGRLAAVLGAQAASLGQEDALCVVEELVEIITRVVPPLMASLRARSEFKDQLRLHQTMIKAQDNNPLKFYTNSEEVLEHILLNTQPGLLRGRNAMQEAMEELAAHQGAMIAALSPALRDTIGHLAPETIQESTDNSGLAGLSFPTGKGKLWDSYVSAFARLKEPGRGNLEQNFMTYLAENYEKLLEK